MTMSGWKPTISLIHPSLLGKITSGIHYKTACVRLNILTVHFETFSSKLTVWEGVIKVSNIYIFAWLLPKDQTCAVSPCHNWLPTALKHFAIANLAIRTSCHFRCTMHRICHVVLWDKMVASGRLWILNMFKIQRQHLAIQIVALGLTNSRTTLHNVVLTRNSVARIWTFTRFFSSLYTCVVRPWEYCKTCRIWSCNVVLPLHVTCPLV